jgi:hypothetical protein
MEIRTGLRPRVRRFTQPRSGTPLAISLLDSLGVLETPPGLPRDLWCVELEPEGQPGLVANAIITGKEPVITKEGHAFPSPLTRPNEWPAQEAWVRGKYNVPEDARIEDREDEEMGVRLRQLSWWKVTV